MRCSWCEWFERHGRLKLDNPGQELALVDVPAMVEYAGRGDVEREKVLACLGIPPYTEKYSAEEVAKLKETFGLVGCARCLMSAFILDILLPPPFRPPIAFILCWTSRTCP